ncbi:uncharacterized protein LOC122381616 [Amphibalanus amphitrite]|uniref:uncharacterized protein LOC122381616 n=1 Tax=Amphibalanus amphitrite TaxID=1232801 RepID=UPI001C91F36A|nr:uncharacterized protein LOC122381616 [Amphibalanus amphitrite]
MQAEERTEATVLTKVTEQRAEKGTIVYIDARADVLSEAEAELEGFKRNLAIVREKAKGAESLTPIPFNNESMIEISSPIADKSWMGKVNPMETSNEVSLVSEEGAEGGLGLGQEPPLDPGELPVDGREHQH